MILVTGGTGLTGSHLLFELTSRGEKVRATKRSGSSVDFVRKVFALYSNNPNILFDQIEWIDVELIDYRSVLDATRAVDTVFHTGAVVSFNPKDADSIRETNIKGTANVVDACIENGVKTLCHISSIASLGEPNQQGIIDENCNWTKSKGQSQYAKSKFHGEMEVWRGAEQGLRVVIVNPSVILGPGRWNSGSGQLFRRISKGMPFFTSGVNGYVDVRDVAKTLVLLNDNKEIVNERFILNSENLSFKELFTLMAQGLGKRVPAIEIKSWIVSIAYPFIKLAGMIVGKGTAVSRSNLRSAFSKTYYSSEKVKKAIGFKFIPIADSIRFVSKIYQDGL